MAAESGLVVAEAGLLVAELGRLLLPANPALLVWTLVVSCTVLMVA